MPSPGQITRASSKCFVAGKYVVKALVYNQPWTILVIHLVARSTLVSCVSHPHDHRDPKDWAVALKIIFFFFLLSNICLVIADLPEGDEDGELAKSENVAPLDWPCSQVGYFFQPRMTLSCCDNGQQTHLRTHSSKIPNQEVNCTKYRT